MSPQNATNFDVMHPTDVLFALFSLVSLFAQIVVIAVILKSRDLRTSSFYMLSVALGVVDICTISSHYVFQRFAHTGIFPPSFYFHFGDYSILSEMCTNGFSYFKSLQRYLLIAIGFNRFCAIVLPFAQNLRTTRVTLLTIATAVVLTSLPHIVISSLTSSYYYQSKSNGVRCRLSDKFLFTVHISYMVYQSVVAAIVLLVLNVAIFGVLAVNRCRLEKFSAHRRRHFVQVKLAIIVAVHVLLLIGDTLAGMFTFIRQKREMLRLVQIIQDVLCSCNPYLLLLFSSEIRENGICDYFTPVTAFTDNMKLSETETCD